MDLHRLHKLFTSIVFAAMMTALPSLSWAVWTDAERENLAQPERGLFVEFDFGTLIFMGNAGSNTNPGILTGMGIGYDIGQYLQVGAHFWSATNNSSGLQYEGTSATIFTPDVQSMLMMGEVKLLYPTSKRLHLTGRFAGGILTGRPQPSRIFAFNADDHIADPEGGESSAVVGFGAGVEYYTRLRHFSIGAEAAVDYLLGPGGLALRIYPVVKYTF